MDLVMAKPEVVHGSSLPVRNTAPVSPIRGHLTPLLRRIVFVGQPGLGKWLPETGNVFPFSCARWLRPTRSRFWRGDRRTCSSKSSREADRERPTGTRQRVKSGFQVVRVAQSRFGAVRRYGQGGITGRSRPVRPKMTRRSTAASRGTAHPAVPVFPSWLLWACRRSGLSVGSPPHSRRNSKRCRRSQFDPKRSFVVLGGSLAILS